MITTDSKSATLVREHHLACELEDLQCVHMQACADLWPAIIKKQNVLKKKMLIATINDDQEAINYYSEQYRCLLACGKDFRVVQLEREMDRLANLVGTL